MPILKGLETNGEMVVSVLLIHQEGSQLMVKEKI